MRSAKALWPLLVWTAFTAPAGAVDIYHWVDERGVAHYSQWAPPKDAPGVETVTVQDENTAGLGGDVYPVDRIAEQTAEIRAQMEEDRAERRERAQRGQASPVVVYEQPVADAVWPVWPVWPPGHPGKPGRPGKHEGRGFPDFDDDFGPGKDPGRGPGGDRGSRNPPSFPFKPPGDAD